jgi:Zn-dependent protease/predicted transcriptional regulator
MRGSLRVGRIFGVDIHIDWSWLFIFFLISWNLATAFTLVQPEWGALQTWIVAIVAALLFFVSVLLHELAHSLVAIAQGVPVRSITLFLFGGIGNVQREPTTPLAEFLIAIVGPLTNFIIGVVLSLLVGMNAVSIDTMTGVSVTIVELSPLATILLWLSSVNILLAIFNMIPGFPLDGGRVLRSIIWAITGNLRKATRWASGIGQVIAWLFIFAGIMMVFGVSFPFLGMGLVNGLWIAFIGWFLYSAAVQSYQQVVIQDVLHDVPVARVMRPNPPTVPSNIPISSLVYDYVMRTDDNAFPVVDREELLGMVTLDDVRSVPREEWNTRTVRDIMTPLQELVVATPEEDAATALDKLMKLDVRQLPVVREGRLAGLLRLNDIVKWLGLQADMQLA